MKLKNRICLIFFLGLISSCASHSIPVRYETADAKEFTADLFLPAKKSNTPVSLVVVIHGGGWKDRTGDMEGICKRLNDNGIAALNITYRFAPEFHYPVQLNDVKAAIPWALQHAKEYNLNDKDISVWGYSAGAQLAFLLANQTDLNTKIKAIVIGGTPTYFAAYPDSPLITDFMGMKYSENPKAWNLASPVSFVTEKTPPTFIYHGEEDSLVGIDQAEMLAAKLTQYKVPHQLFRVKNSGHLSVYFFSRESEDKAIEFIKSISP